MDQVLALSWHPGKTSIISSGGYRRFYEVAKRSPVPLTIYDRYPTQYSDLSSQQIKIIEYGHNLNFSWIYHLHPLLGSLVERIYTVIVLIRLIAFKKSIIYLPFSELSHLTFPAVISKVISHSKIILCNLNVNTIPLERPLNRWLHSFSDHTITISSALKSDLANNGIKVESVNGVGLTFNPPHSETKLNQLIFIGRHIPQKGFLDLLEIWKEVLTMHNKNLKLVTIGDTPAMYTELIQKLISDYQIESSITIKGQVSDVDKYKLLAQSKIMLFPSLQEGWGIAPMEALATGVPVIAYDLPVYRESIGLSKAFITLPIHDKHAFAKAVVKVLNNWSFYSQAAFKWHPVVDWDTIAKQEWSIICQP